MPRKPLRTRWTSRQLRIIKFQSETTV